MRTLFSSQFSITEKWNLTFSTWLTCGTFCSSLLNNLIIQILTVWPRCIFQGFYTNYNYEHVQISKKKIIMLRA